MTATLFTGPRWIWPSRQDQPEDPLAQPPWWDGVLAALLVGAFLWFYGRWVFDIGLSVFEAMRMEVL